MRVLITGAKGQLGLALSNIFPDSVKVDSDELDITQKDQVGSFDASGIDAIVNAAAYTKVDDAQKEENQDLAKRVNAEGVANLVILASANGIPIVHISTDYVFNGQKVGQYTEEDEFDPFSIYGKTKAAGDLEVAKVPKHYIFRTSWVIGEGNNFVRIMSSLAKKDINPNVVDDQFGRLTFTDTLAEAIKFALENNIPYGTYNLTNDGEVANWADIAKLVFKLNEEDPDRVAPVSTEQYFEGKEGPVAPRPANSALDLSKIKAAGFTPEDWQTKLKEYITKEGEK